MLKRIDQNKHYELMQYINHRLMEKTGSLKSAEFKH